jgi:hypothetical protein
MYANIENHTTLSLVLLLCFKLDELRVMVAMFYKATIGENQTYRTSQPIHRSRNFPPPI